MSINKSSGVTQTEKDLSFLCENTFLKAWSYPNPIKSDGKELCDLLVIFENNIFIFFDRENKQLKNIDGDLKVKWERWKRKTIDSQIKTAHGVVRYLKDGNDIFLDQKCQKEIPVKYDSDKVQFHKIIVAHGASEACKQYYGNNASGGLIISYSKTHSAPKLPFFLYLKKDEPIHVFDTFTLPIILKELDTIYDFNKYLCAKESAIRNYVALLYCGEEDLLAHYFYNFDELTGKYFIGTKKENFNAIHIAEGEWEKLINSEIYKRKKEKDKVSYFWDELLQRTTQNALDGILEGDQDIYFGHNPILEMAKEPRFARRALSEHMINSIRKFPENESLIVRYVSFMHSFYPDKAYVFLQLKIVDKEYNLDEIRSIRKNMLECACGAAKNKFPSIKLLIGIAISAPKYTNINSEDFMLFECEEWPDDRREKYLKANETMRFFETENMIMYRGLVKEFPDE